MREKFLNYLQAERNYSVLTVKGYREDLVAFEQYFEGLEGQLSWDTVDSDVVRDWMENMMDRGNSATSINRRLSALRSFYRFALSRGLLQRNPTRGVRGPKKTKPLPQYVKEGELDLLLERMEWGEDYKDVRARTIIILLYETGMRVSELVSLDDSMIDMQQCQLKVTGKRDKQRVIPFGVGMLDAIRRYQTVRDKTVERKEEGLLLSDKGWRMTHQQVRAEVKKQLGRVTTMKKRTPHVLRHSFATSMLNHGAGLEGVKKLLGHESLATTEIYTHTTFEQLKNVYKQAHPRG